MRRGFDRSLAALRAERFTYGIMSSTLAFFFAARGFLFWPAMPLMAGHSTF
jgi:hypothetical protein